MLEKETGWLNDRLYPGGFARRKPNKSLGCLCQANGNSTAACSTSNASGCIKKPVEKELVILAAKYNMSKF
jgi:hypothetical protein